MGGEPGRDALAAIDRILEEQPKAGERAFAEAVRHAAAFREVLIAKSREGGGPHARQDLLRANAILSIVMAGSFPVGEVSWDSLKSARKELAAMLEASGAVGDR